MTCPECENDMHKCRCNVLKNNYLHLGKKDVKNYPHSNKTGKHDIRLKMVDLLFWTLIFSLILAYIFITPYLPLDW